MVVRISNTLLSPLNFLIYFFDISQDFERTFISIHLFIVLLSLSHFSIIKIIISYLFLQQPEVQQNSSHSTVIAQYIFISYYVSMLVVKCWLCSQNDKFSYTHLYIHTHKNIHIHIKEYINSECNMQVNGVRRRRQKKKT